MEAGREGERDGTAETGEVSGEVRFPGSDVLRGSSPKEILGRVLEGDPLDILQRGLGVLTKEALLLNPSAFVDHAMARVAFEAMSYRGRPSLGEWLGQCLGKATRDLLQEQQHEEFRRLPVTESPDADYYRLISQHSRIELEFARLMCVTVNCLPLDQRRVFFAVTVGGKTVQRYVAEGYGPPKKAKHDLHKASKAVLRALARRRKDGGCE